MKLVGLISRLFLFLAFIWPSSIYFRQLDSDSLPLRDLSIALPNDAVPSVAIRRHDGEKQCSTLKPPLAWLRYALSDHLPGSFLLQTQSRIDDRQLVLGFSNIRSPPPQLFG